MNCAPPIVKWLHVNVHYGYLIIKDQIPTFDGLIGLIGCIYTSQSLCGILIGIDANSRENGIVSPSVILVIEIMEYLIIQKNSIMVFQLEIQIVITKLIKVKDTLYIWLAIIVFSKELNDYVAFNERRWQTTQRILKIWTVICWIELQGKCQTYMCITIIHMLLMVGNIFFLCVCSRRF